MINSTLNQIAVRDLTLSQWKSLHFRTGLAALSIPLIFIAPSIFSRHNSFHLLGRAIAPLVALAGGGIILKTAGEIETLEPLVEQIQNQKIALLKNGLNSETYTQTKFNSLNAGREVFQLAESLEPAKTEEVSPEPIPEKPSSFNRFPASEPNGNQLTVTAVTTEFTQQELQSVSHALAEGFSDSVIIKDILGYSGRTYSEGKVKLEKIKEYLSGSKRINTERDNTL